MSRFKDRAIAIEEHVRRIARLGDLAARSQPLLCWCNRCAHAARLDSALLCAALGPHFPVPEIGARLRCSNCGAKDVATRPDLAGIEERSELRRHGGAERQS